MKKLRNLCLVVLFCLPNMVFAHEGIRVFDSYASPDLFNEQVEVWSGCPTVGDLINTDCLAGKAYEFARSNGALSLVPERNQDRVSYKDLFLRWNGLGSTMSTARFMRKASGTGFYLPQGRGRAVPLSTREWSTIRGEVDLLQQQMRTLEPESAKSMRARINDLENRLAGVDSTTAELLGTLSTREAMVKNFSTLSLAELNAQKAEMEDRLSGFNDRLARVENTKADKSDVISLEARVSSLENPSLSAPFTSVETTGFLAKVNERLVKYWWIPVLLLLLVAIMWLLKSRKNTSNTEAVITRFPLKDVVPSDVRTTTDDQYETLHLQVHDPKTGVLARVGRLEEVVNHENGVLARMEKLDTAVTQLRTDYDYLLLVSTDGLRMVGTPDQETLEALKIGEHIDLKIEGDEGDRTVRIVRGTFENEHGGIEERLYVYGVSDVNQGVSVDSVRLSRSLLRAIKEWKLVGIDDPKVGLSAAAFARTPRKLTFRRSVKKAA